MIGFKAPSLVICDIFSSAAKDASQHGNTAHVAHQLAEKCMTLSLTANVSFNESFIKAKKPDKRTSAIVLITGLQCVQTRCTM